MQELEMVLNKAISSEKTNKQNKTLDTFFWIFDNRFKSKNCPQFQHPWVYQFPISFYKLYEDMIYIPYYLSI